MASPSCAALPLVPQATARTRKETKMCRELEFEIKPHFVVKCECCNFEYGTYSNDDAVEMAKHHIDPPTYTDRHESHTVYVTACTMIRAK